MPKTRNELDIELTAIISAAWARLRTERGPTKVAQLNLEIAEAQRQLAQSMLPDGLYRVEFIGGERRSNPNHTDLHVEVVDGVGKGRRLCETLSLATWPPARSAANRVKLEAYAQLLRVTGDLLDPENWMLRPFVADVVDARIVAIRGDDGTVVCLPAASSPTRELVWSPETGWDFAPLGAVTA